MNKTTKILIILLISLFVLPTYALTKPAPGADTESLSYAIHLYYDAGKLFADRDYEVKYDIINEKFVPEPITLPGLYKAEIINYKYQVVSTFQFDPKGGNSNLQAGKVVIKGPYVPDGLRINFYDNNGNQLLNIFINTGSICNDDNLCDALAGETEKTCPNDCKKTTSPRTTITPEAPVVNEDYDLNTILIYTFSGLGVGVGAWFGWKMWKKRKEENFPLPPPSAPTPRSSLPPMPPVNP